MSSYSHVFNSPIQSFIPNAAINNPTQPITPTIVINALKLFLLASLQFQRMLKLKRFQKFDFSIRLCDDAPGALGRRVFAGFSFEILLHDRYVTKTDDITINAAI